MVGIVKRYTHVYIVHNLSVHVCSNKSHVQVALLLLLSLLYKKIFFTRYIRKSMLDAPMLESSESMNL